VQVQVQLLPALSTPIDIRKLGHGRQLFRMPIRISPYIITNPKKSSKIKSIYVGVARN